MKDIPVFTTEFGISSLSLGQIPYRGVAYVHVRSFETDKLGELVDECAHFCRAAGADKVFWTAEGVSATAHSVVYEMRGHVAADPALVENLFPVTEQTVAQWRQIHNERMNTVDHAVYLTQADEKELLRGNAYFIHNGGKLLGIGWLEDDTIRTVASIQPGAGERIIHTLLTIAPEDLRLEVASTNFRAIRLYEKLGFVKTGEIKKWYLK